MSARAATFGPEDVAALAAGPSANGQAQAGTLRQRLDDARIDLIAYIDCGIPERAWLPSSECMLARGKRHHVAAPLKSGKSLGFLAHAVDMTIAGARVVILDRENGADEYGRRLRDILADRPSNAPRAIRARLAYYPWPALKLTDGQQLGEALHTPDIVIIDSTRTFLSGFDLDEDSSDDFAKFAAAIVEPLFRAGIATLQLDNSGHGDNKRARGTSSKGDLADVVFNVKTTAAFDHRRRGSLRLTRQHSRLGEVAPAFTMELGGGHFGRFVAEEAVPSESGFRPTHLMEKISRALEDTSEGLSTNGIQTAIGAGKNREAENARRLALELLIDERYITVAPGPRNAKIHRSLRPFRETDDDRPRTAPAPPPGTVQPTVPLSPPPYGGQGTEDSPAGPGDRPQPLNGLTADCEADDV